MLPRPLSPRTFTEYISTKGATPRIPILLSFAANTPATAVPWP